MAEFLGTFTLVFIGAGAGTMADQHKFGILGVALAHGLALLVIAYAWGSISGAHVNPAITASLALTGKIPWGKAAAYWVAQFAAAGVAAYTLKFLLAEYFHNAGIESSYGSTIGVFTQGLDENAIRVVVLEGILTFFLAIAVFASGVEGKNGNAAGLAIGLVLTMDILVGGSLTGASMNPARTFGPALVVGDFSYLWMYIVGPTIGACLAGLVYNGLFLVSPQTEKKKK
ncbi:MAG: MIP/aquaporin family protein [Pirellulales bacterium]